MTDRRYDATIIGAGIVGLATGRELLRRHPGLRLGILEKEPRVAAHQTGHNSGVIHSGVYYAPGSLKARLCVAGAAALTRFCDERGIAYQRCGKVIVATMREELPRLDELHRRGQANGVPGLEMIGPERLRELEPHAVGIKALYSPSTGIVAFTRVAEALAAEVRERGGEIVTGHEVTGISRAGRRVLVGSVSGLVDTRFVITCGGLQADALAAMTGAPDDLRIVPFRGDYHVLRPERRHLVRTLIYPVPDPSLPFLGVHFTRRPDGEVWLGPNAVLAFAREGYRRRDVNLLDSWRTLSYGGFRKLARAYWQVGLAEMVRDFRPADFVKALQRYVPELSLDDVQPGPSGVRAQALSTDGRLLDDFSVLPAENVIHVRNAPSPAATSALAIAGMIVDTAERTFGLAPQG